MTRLYDRLRPDIEIDEYTHDVLHDGKYRTVVFEISNVADYHRANAKTYAGLADFPNVGPPFGAYWMEWRRPRDRFLPGRVGVMVLGVDGHDDASGVPEGVRWSIGVVAFIEGRAGRGVRLADWMLHVDEDGHITVKHHDIGDPWVQFVLGPGPPLGHAKPDDELVRDLEEAAAIDDLEARHARLDELRDEAARRLVDAEQRIRDVYERTKVDLGPILDTLVLHPVLLAHSLLACKNVDTEDHAPPAKLSRKHQRKKGEPLVVFRTLVIRPMGAKRSGPGETMSIGDGELAFHIVRGHPKTFTAERPLFGKHVGTYWWSPAARGDREHGEIVKDYRVDPDATVDSP